MNIISYIVIAFIVGVFGFSIYNIAKYGFVSTGEYGEKRVANILAKLPPEQYTVINDLMLKTVNGSTQIDHVVVSVYGIFVIETKCYQGSIYGSRNAEYWTQNIYGNKYQLFNPIRQNLSHVRAIKELLGEQYKDIFIEPVVVFVGSATLSDYLLSEQTIYSGDLLNWIYRFSDVKIHNPNPIYDLLLNGNMVDEQRVGHVQYVQQVQQQQSQKIENGICPRCGGKLVFRKGRYGNFWGCSNYPRCKFTLNES